MLVSSTLAILKVSAQETLNAIRNLAALSVAEL